MEVVAAPSGGAPFHDHDVREWSRIDSITGALERARLETDHWSANTINSSHKYGKVVDSRARSDADGALHQIARRQLEVFHSEVPGARLQVVKTQTVSSSKWSATNSSSTTKTTINEGLLRSNKDFENLQLSLNPLDLSSQKSKASVGRSASRRPPSRQRAKDHLQPSIDLTDPFNHAHITAATNLHRVSRLCHQIHENAVRQAFGRRSPRPIVTEPDSPDRPNISDRESADGSVEIYEIESVSSENNKNSGSTNGHTNLTRTKSSSSDDISFIPEKETDINVIEDSEDQESWKRTSKLRRSLQFPKQNTKPPSSKPVDLPNNKGSVRKIREELEKGRRLNTALRNNSIDLDALDQILQSISSSGSDKTADDTEVESTRKQKRNSFVTVESIREVKDRLRRTNSPTNDIYKETGNEEYPDDGIVTEDMSPAKENEMPFMENSRVRSYVYGMENVLNKKPGIGTGSLESRIKLIPTNKNEDWYNRRKSYGFEKVHNHNDTTTSILLKNKNLVESSTDSGICRSTEIVIPLKKNGYKDNAYSSDEHNEFEQKYNEFQNTKNSQHTGQVKRIASNFNQEISPSPTSKTKFWDKTSSEWSNSNGDLKSTTITIPISKNHNIVDLSWNNSDREQFQSAKRHSIAVDESKYVIKSPDNSFRRISLALNDQVRSEDDENNMRKTKKVEFCKTEVHFAAESGKVNIVATDDKPPPTQNFRRRRRNSGPSLEDFNKNGLPLLHFGDTIYDKALFNKTDNETTSEAVYEDLQTRVPTFALVTVNSGNSLNADASEDEKKDLTDNEIKGILKNKPLKPKPYHLGETVPFQNGINVSDDENKWGVRLRHVEKPDVPIWKSTVTVHNYNFINQTEKNEPEFQKLLKNLRPTRKTDYASDSETNFLDNGMTSWSSPEIIEPSKEAKVAESKGYSTKICLREGEATVLENDSFKKEEPTIRPKIENLRNDNPERLENTETSPLVTHNSEPSKKHISINIIRPNLSPSPVRKTPAGRKDLKPSEKLSSPSIVNNRSKQIEVNRLSERVNVDNFKTSSVDKISAKFNSDGMVLRQPKKSEMTYFGVKVSPKPIKKISQAVIHKENKLSEKHDLTHYHRKSPSPTRLQKSPPTTRRQKSPSPTRRQKIPSPTLRQKSPSPTRRQKSPTFNCSRRIKPVSPPTRARQKSPDKIKEEPIYENIKNKYGREFDSSILDELTKAADQILQAVNGYTDEEIHNRLSSDEDESKNRLETILETKSVRQRTPISHLKATKPKSKFKPASPSSSIESLTRKKATPEPKLKPCYEKHRRRTERVEKNERTITKTQQTTKFENSHLKSSSTSTTKARRLQRASSREALLRSNGSSSEDLPAKIEPPRKPRLVKKTKAMQLTITNGLEMKKPTPNSPLKKKDEFSSRGEERILNSLPEIRHKTAVSTIRSTSEKTARDRLKQKNEDLRRKTQQKKETNKVTSSSTRFDRDKSLRSPAATAQKETVTHRISTANIKKCYRADGATRH